MPYQALRLPRTLLRTLFLQTIHPRTIHPPNDTPPSHTPPSNDPAPDNPPPSHPPSPPVDPQPEPSTPQTKGKSIWTSTLTLGSSVDNSTYGFLGGSSSNTYGELSNSSVNYWEIDYNVKSLIYTLQNTPRTLTFSLGTLLVNSDNLVLYIDKHSFPLREATMTHTNEYRWSHHEISWNLPNLEVPVELVEVESPIPEITKITKNGDTWSWECSVEIGCTYRYFFTDTPPEHFKELLFFGASFLTETLAIFPPLQSTQYLYIQVKQGVSLTSTAVATFHRKKIFVGQNNTCAILNNGRVKCWGLNKYAQLGQGHTKTLGNELGEMGNNLPPIDLGTTTGGDSGKPLTAKDMALGGEFSHLCYFEQWPCEVLGSLR